MWAWIGSWRPSVPLERARGRCGGGQDLAPLICKDGCGRQTVQNSLLAFLARHNTPELRLDVAGLRDGS